MIEIKINLKLKYEAFEFVAGCYSSGLRVRSGFFGGSKNFEVTETHRNENKIITKTINMWMKRNKKIYNKEKSVLSSTTWYSNKYLNKIS